MGRRGCLTAAAIGVIAAVLAASSAPTANGQAPPDQLSVGEWSGHATALGVTQASGSGLTIIIQGTFGATLGFSVPNEGATTGRWSLNGTTNWRLLFAGAAGTAFAVHSADGEMVGNRQQIGLGRSTITTGGTASVPGAGEIAISSADPLGPLDLTVAGLVCDDVWGEWVLSWNTILSGAQFTPTFRGNWQARRIDVDGPSVERTRAILPELFDLRDRLVATWNGAQAVDGIPQLPVETITELIQESVELINELNALSSCDREYLGEDEVQQWIYSFTTAVSLLAAALADAVERESEGFAPVPTASSMPVPDLVEWATALAASGAVGPGSLDPAAPRTLEGLAASVLAATDDDSVSPDDRTTATALAVQLGLVSP